MRHSSPNEASQIAGHTAQMLAALRRASSKSEARDLSQEWFRWADHAGVCKPIRDHFAGATAEMLSRFPDAKRPVIRNPAGAD